MLCTLFLSQLFTSLIALASPQQESCWLRTELLYWATKKDCCIPLVTLASLADSLPGALGQPGTRICLSTSHLPHNSMAGFRFSAGTYVNACDTIGLELNYFLLPTHHSRRRATTSGQPGSLNLAVPVYDITGVWGLNGVAGETIAVLPGPLFGQPGFFGNFNACGTRKFQGAGLNGVFQLCDFDCSEISLSAGFGWMQLSESVIFSGQTHTDPNASIASDFFNFTDMFKTKNNFYGMVCGIRAEQTYNSWKIHLMITGGLGVVHNQRKIAGSSMTASGNLFFLTSHTANQALVGGIFTQPSNIGRFKQHKLGGMVEGVLRVGYCLTESTEVSLGYDFIFFNHVARAAHQIDRKINSTRTSLADASRATVGVGPGPIPFGEPAAAPAPIGNARPVPLCTTNSFWAQGLIAGVVFYF